MPQSPFVQPPRLAAWLVALFAPYEQAEAIPGDLLEEFSELAVHSGPASARRWYWRQCMKTIAHLFVDGFRVAHWSIAGSLLAAGLVGLCCNWLAWKMVVAVLSRYRVYTHVDVRLFWFLYDNVLLRVLVPMLMGCAAAATAKGREMIASVTLGVLVATGIELQLLIMYASHAAVLTRHGLVDGYIWMMLRPSTLAITLDYLLAVLPRLILMITIAIGGGIVRKIRREHYVPGPPTV